MHTYKKTFLIFLCVLFIMFGLFFPTKTAKAGSGIGIGSILALVGAPTGAWIDYLTCGVDLSWDDSRCANPQVANGSCGNTSSASGINSCSSGYLGQHTAQSGGVYDWYCMGVNGGANSSLCRYIPPAPINAACGDITSYSAIYTCASGTLGAHTAQSCGQYDWYCVGSNGGTNSGLCRYTPSSCSNGANNPPCCTTYNSCSNGANNPPTCNRYSPCTNGGNNPPTCTPPRVNPPPSNPPPSNPPPSNPPPSNPPPSSVVWTNYCTGTDAGASPPHPWQIWRYDNSNPINYQFVENGTVANGCVPNAPTHLACQNNACVSVAGGGSNSCTSNADCVVAPTHMECRNNACVSVAGEGSNLCTSNANCSSDLSCDLPWGGSITSGSSVVAYQSPSVNSPAVCVSQNRNCNDGTLSGSYTNQSCTVNPANSGACSSPATHYTCSAGTSINNISSPSRWVWTCKGSGTGLSVTCFERKSPGFMEN